jgi:hypothetical protein
MIQPQKRLVFHFFVDYNWEESITNQIHFKCLKFYGHIFDEVFFNISVDNINDIDLIKNFQLKILSLGLTHNITFNVIENCYLRDSKTFFNEIVEKMGEYSGLTFFGHNKGTTNINIMDLEAVSKWITSLYYFSMEYMDEVTYLLTDGREISYGPLLVAIDYNYLPNVLEDGTTKEDFKERAKAALGRYKYFYMGTFFWLNTLVLDDYVKKNAVELPKLSDRWYAENFFANIFPMGFAYSHNGRYSVNYLNGGAEIDVLLSQIATDDELINFNEFNKRIIESL